MWDRIDSLLEEGAAPRPCGSHRVELLEARRRRASGLDVGALASHEAAAAVCDLAVIPLLARVREVWDGPLVMHKGPSSRSTTRVRACAASATWTC